VGLIVSCFNSSPAPDCSNRMQVIAFQSVQGAEASYEFDFDGLDSPTREALQASADGVLLGNCATCPVCACDHVLFLAGCSLHSTVKAALRPLATLC
jgi:hypothetical protein